MERPRSPTPEQTNEPVSLALDWDAAADCEIDAVALGGMHGCARTTQGHVYCWGSNWSQQLGAVASERCTLGSLDYPCSHDPLPVRGLHNVRDLAVSNEDSCALDANGQVWCWGSSQSRIFGDATRCTAGAPSNLTCSPSPALVAGVDAGVSLGAWGTQCAAQRDGVVKCWVAHMGFSPTAVPDVTDAVQTDYECARTRSGQIQCWWCNDRGQRGDGTLGPEQQVGVASNCQLTTSTVAWQGQAVDVSSGYEHACLVDANGAVACWGDARGGDLGLPPAQFARCNYGDPCAKEPVRMPGVTRAVQVAAGYHFTCVREADGSVSCTSPQGALAKIALPASATQVSARYSQACAVVEGGRVFCWQPPATSASEVVFCPQ